MKHLLSFIIVFFLCLTGKAQNVNKDIILGNWISPEKDLIVNCYKVNDQYFGKVVWFKVYNDNKHGVNAAVPENQWLNSVVMKHFVFNGNSWKEGEIYDLNSGKTYDSYIEAEGDNILKVTGYVWFTFLGETIRFNRYTDAKLPASQY